MRLLYESHTIPHGFTRLDTLRGTGPALSFRAMSKAAAKPLIGLPACIKQIDGMPYHTVQDKYLRAVVVAAGGLPLVIPAFGDECEPARLIEMLDGLLMTGSPSNVHPRHYGRAAHREAEPHDEERDATTLPLINMALDAGLPLVVVPVSPPPAEASRTPAPKIWGSQRPR